MDQIEEIQDRANEENIGSNEAELQIREDVADLIIEKIDMEKGKAEYVWVDTNFEWSIELAKEVKMLKGTIEECLENYSTIMPGKAKRLLEGALEENKGEEPVEDNSEGFKALKKGPYFF